MNIQVLTNNNITIKYDENKKYTINNLDKHQSFNEFDFNVIDLDNSEIWLYDDKQKTLCVTVNFFTILPNILHNTKNKVLLILPQNQKVTNYKYDTEVKDTLKDIENYINGAIKINTKIEYDRSKTIINKREFSSDFVMKNYYNQNVDVILKSLGGNDVLIRHKSNNNIFITTLKIDKNNISEIIDFLQCSFNKSESPVWIKDIELFNDKSLILKKEELENNIKSIQQNIDKNNAIRSILYSTGDELVVTIIDILHDIFSVDKNFNDVKKEDFRFEFKDFTFMIEIKGIKDNVSNKNIAQCKKFVSDLISSNENINPSNTKGILIINSQRDKSPLDRDNIHEQQISYAKRENILTITTFEFLKLYDTYKKNKIDANKCFEIFRDMIGEFKFENTKDLKNDT
ncbi:hypothetical protein [Campylobacter pinnipediorum]|uniref:hypothetical protein n=1 Tax=Campylobacter pinnipediorum TaxID=1965231 RepID=UPI000994B701|nr:hypothetical protein [Campylobacter pinnipediorum]AQW82885.1 hypothetical protein CPIN17261_0875 [Campylobacter pinnipediorum subsp. pinnipediorum]